MRDAAWPIAQTTAAATLAWTIAEALLPQPRPAFAPLTAIIALGATLGERGERAIQVAVGVALGVGAAELVVRLLGVGPGSLALVTALALGGAIFVSTAGTFVAQAGVTAALVVAVGPTESVGANRFLEALVGGAVALVFSQVLFPFRATDALRSTLCSILGDLAGALHDGAGALSGEDPERLQDVRRAVQRTAVRLTEVDEARRSAEHAVRRTRRRRGGSRRLEHLTEIAGHLDNAMGDAGALVRSVLRLAEDDRPLPDALAEGLAALGDLAERTADRVAGRADDDGAMVACAERAVACMAAARADDGRHTVATSTTLARSTAGHLLRMAGMARDAADDVLDRGTDRPRRSRDADRSLRGHP